MAARGVKTFGLLVALATCVGLASGCKKRSEVTAAVSPPAISGLAVVPASAELVLSFDVTRVGASALVRRAVGELLARNAELAQDWERLRVHCGVDMAQLRRVVIAAAPSRQAQAVSVVVVGSFTEATLLPCLKAMIGSGGGELTTSLMSGRSVHHVREAGRQMYLAFGQADTVVLSPELEWLTDSLGAGPKAADNGALRGPLGRVDQGAPIWGAGLPGTRVGQGLVRLGAGAISAGPSSLGLSLDPGSGVDLQLTIEMAGESDASALELLINKQLPLVVMAAQVASLGPLVSKLRVKRDGAAVGLRLSLAPDELNQALEAIDTMASDQQDAPPATPSAPAAAHTGG